LPELAGTVKPDEVAAPEDDDPVADPVAEVLRVPLATVPLPPAATPVLDDPALVVMAVVVMLADPMPFCPPDGERPLPEETTAVPLATTEEATLEAEDPADDPDDDPEEAEDEPVADEEAELLVLELVVMFEQDRS